MSNNSFDSTLTNILEKSFSSFINDVVENIVTHVIEFSEITGVLTIGSLAKQEMRYYSNINLIFFTTKESETLYTFLKKILSNKLAYSLLNHEKMLFYLDYETDVEKRVIEVEILLKTSVPEIENLIIGSNLELDDLTNIILFDKTKQLKKDLSIILQKNVTYKSNIPEIIRSLTNDFIHNFAKACFSMRKTALYQYFIAMSNCYSILVKLEAIRNDNVENFNQPVFALGRLDLRKDFPFYRINLPNISISDKDLRLKYVFQFTYLTSKLSEKYKLAINYEENEKFLKKLDKEVYFWNLRDISYLDPEHLKKGVFYRSSTLSRYNDQKELQKFFENQNINTIIDLRSDEEVSAGPYKDIKNVRIVNIPIGEKPDMDLTKLKYITSDSFNVFYEIFLRFHHSEIIKIFNTLASEEGAFVLHCYAGRDRTGLVVALLLELLGEKAPVISEGLIAEDYLNTGNNTEKDVFNVYKKTLKEFGNARNYLQTIGLTNESINKIVDKFIK